ILYFRAAGVRGLDEHEEPAAVAPARGEEGLDRVAAEIGIDRQRVGKWRVCALSRGNLPVPPNPLHLSADADGGLRPRLEERGGIGAGGGTDIAPLAVGDHE